MARSWWAALLTLAAYLTFPLCPFAAAQEAENEATVVEPFSSPQAATAQPIPQAAKGAGSQPAGAAALQPAAQNAAADANTKTSDKKKDGESKTPAPVSRPKEPPTPADPAELRVRPAADGIVRFSFRNQSWPAVLQWLADVSGLSLDWQELPGDYLNISLQRGYTLDEARDLINRHLLARGYTMLLDGETLTVVKLDQLNLALVPRVAAEELTDRQPHEFVKVSFALAWMLAETAAEELKPMLSPQGKLFAFKETNRLEAIDAVVNLREIHRLLTQEQSPAGEDRLVREFPLQHTRAADVRGLLLELLGIDSKAKAPPAPLTPEQMQMMQQQQAMMQQQMAQSGGRGAAKPADAKKDEVSLVVNQRNNSILATAPPNKMAIVAQAVQMLDVPAASGQSLLANMTKLQIYRLSSITPEPIVKTLQELGDLSPQTRLEVDAKNRAIIAYATLADHVSIRAMVEKLDGSARSFEVIPLRRLSADYVAGTLRFLLGGEEESKQEQRYPSYFYLRERNEDQAAKDAFRVDADVENNRLLVWANPSELEEVLELLEKLGEIPQRGGDPRRVRTVEILPSQQTRAFFEQLEKSWRSLVPNELQVDPVLEEPKSVAPEANTGPETETKTGASPKDGESPRSPPAPAADDTTARTAVPTRRPEVSPTALVQRMLRSAEHAPAEEAPVPPVRITRGRDGRLVVASQDAAALDLLEDLLREMAPRRKDFEVFQLRYAPAFWVTLNLEDFFKQDDKDNNRASPFGYWYWDMPQETRRDDPRRLSQRRPLKFISDDDTNTIVVQGADPQQLETVSQLIELYDQPPPQDAQSRRVTQIFSIRYSKAEVIAEAVKDVYRDLLSVNDKALAQQQQQQNQRPTGETYITNIGFGEEEDQRDRRTQVTFKGKLSIGVDPLSNNLLISTEGEALMSNIREMIERLDRDAQSRTTVKVLRVDGVGASGLQKALAEVFRAPDRSPVSPPARLDGSPNLVQPSPQTVTPTPTVSGP